MREILFRGKRKDNGQWVEGDFCKPCNIVFVDSGYDAVLRADDVPVVQDHQVIPATVGQYTGLTDRNGKKIFEGDIHKFNKKHFVVKYGVFCDCTQREDAYGWYMQDVTEGKCYCLDGTENEYVNIIGNIHDNPELLKGGVE